MKGPKNERERRANLAAEDLSRVERRIDDSDRYPVALAAVRAGRETMTREAVVRMTRGRADAAKIVATFDRLVERAIREVRGN